MAIVGASIVGGAIEAAGIVPSDPGVSDLGADGTEWDDIWVTQAFVSADAGQANATADDLVVGNTGGSGVSTGISILTDNAGTARLLLGDAADDDVAGIRYDHSLNVFYFRWGGADRLQGNGQVMYPPVTNTFALGSTALRWSNVFSTLATVGPVSAAGTAGTSADDVKIGDTGGSGAAYGLSILTDDAGTCNIFAGDASDNDAGRLIYDHSQTRWQIAAEGTVCVQVNSGALFPSGTKALGTASVPWGTVYRNADVLSNDVTPAALSSGSNDDVSITDLHLYNIVRLSANAAGSTLTSIVVGSVVDGQLFLVSNEASSGDITITHDDAAGTAANRFYIANNGSLVVRPRGCFWMWYDGTASRWRTA